jgi:hypothetical protein
MENKKLRKNTLQIIVALIMLASALLSTGVIFADDDPSDGVVTAEETEVTEEPTAVPTEIPTEVPAEDTPVVPTDEPTSVPTTGTESTPTTEATAEATAEFTETPESELTLTPTVTPTEEMLSAQALSLTSPADGTTIYTRTPTFVWEMDPDATKYILVVYRKSLDGEIRIYEKSYKYSSICDEDDGTCTVKPSTSLTYATYVWKVRPYYADGIYGEFSDPMTFTIATTTPVIEAPSGTIYESSPVLQWTGVYGADYYYILMYDSDGDKVINQMVEEGDYTCEVNDEDEYICSYTYDEAYDNGTYKWKVRAYYSGKYRSYSAYKSFIVASDIDTDFDSYSSDWKKFAGAGWMLGEEDGYTTYYTNGISKKMTSLRTAYVFSDYSIVARVKRESGNEDGSYPASYLAVRMASSKTSSQYLWYTGYIFGYTNAGTYAIWRMDSGGSATAKQPWTYTDAIAVDDWNELKVVAEDDTFEFYINDELMTSFTDSNYSKGYIGLEAYRPDTTASKFWVDSVTVNRIESTSVGSTSVSAQQAAYNQAALSAASTGTVDSYDGSSISAQALEAPTPSSPIDTTIYVTKPTFTWDEVGGATKYYLYLAQVTVSGVEKVAGKTLSADTVCVDGTCSYTYPSTLSKKDYQWKIKSYDGTEWGDYCDIQEFTIGDTMPTAKKPYSTIYENQPTFTWTEIIDADQYNIVVYNSNGTKVVNLFTTDFTCDEGICSVDLDEPFANGKYKWRVRAYYNELWRYFSPYREFTVASDFDSDFDENATGWGRLWGGSWSRSNGYYYTYGKSNVMTSTKYAYVYKNFILDARVRRDPGTLYSSSPANYVAVRMSSYKTSTYQWYTGYIFGYTNAGYYSIWRMKSGGNATAIVPWTYTDYINQGDWNDLRVVADGSDFEFYINSELVNSFTDENYTKGYVGFEMYRPGSANLRFDVDYATLTLIDDVGGTSLSAQSVQSNGISAEQQAYNQAALNSGVASDLEGSPAQ